MPVQVASLFGVLTLDDREFRQKSRDAQSRLQSVGSQMQSVGAQVSLMTAPIAIGLGYAVRQTREFDRTLGNVNSVLGITGSEAGNLRAELLRYGAETVAGPQKTAEAYYNIVSAVQDTSSHMAILRASTATAEAGQADLQATTSALISTMNAYHFAAEDAAFVSDVFSRTVQRGDGYMSDFAAAFPQVTGLAAQFGIGLDDVGGSLAYMTSQGISAGQSATFLRSMITTLLNPTAELETAIQGLGYTSGQALIESEGLIGAYQMLSEQSGGLAGLITNQEALQGAIRLTGDDFTSFIDEYKAGVDGATGRLGAIQDQTEGWDKLRSSIQFLAIMVGSNLAPAISDLIDNYITPAIIKVGDWINVNPELTAQLLGVLGASVLLGPVISVLGTGFRVAGVAVRFLLSPVGILTVAIGGLLFAINELYPGGLAGVLRDAATSAQQLAAILLFGLSQAANWARARLSELLETLLNVIGKIDEFVGRVGAGLGGIQGIGNLLGSGQVNLGQVIGAIQAEFRDSGGPGEAGVPYAIGAQQQGREIFIPTTNGQFVPNATGGGGVTISGPITVVASDPDTLGRALQERARRTGN